MRKIVPKLTKRMIAHYECEKPGHIAKLDAVPINSFRDLVSEVAELSCLNRDHMLFYRGQSLDHRNKAGATTLYPSIYRGEQTLKDELDLRFSYMKSAANSLCEAIDLKFPKANSMKEVLLRKHIQWSILQHYEVCSTPFLDVTQSLSVACSFAFLNSDDNAYLYVLGLPFSTNRISRNSEHELINIRLLSICPPEALRPHYQEGYLVGTDGVDYRHVNKTEYDFNRRLFAKFELFNAGKFWTDGFGPLSEDTLYPKNDQIAEICKDVKAHLATNSTSEDGLGSFIILWSNLERLLLDYSQNFERRSIPNAISTLLKKEIITESEANKLNFARMTRNRAVHNPSSIKIEDLSEARSIIESMIIVLQHRL